MLTRTVPAAIRLRGVRHNNLKNFDIDLPLNRLIVITGLSGSGKSSLAFDTLYAEGQRRYIETFSPYARQFLDRMDKPQVDSIEGIPPAIAIEQRNSVRTTRSTVGTMTEICDYMKCVWDRLSRLHCRGCGQPVQKDPPQHIWQSMTSGKNHVPEALIVFELPLTEKMTLDQCLGLVAKQGYQRVLGLNGILRVEEAASQLASEGHTAYLTVVQDRVQLVPASRPRFVEACEQAYHFGKGKLTVIGLPQKPGSQLVLEDRRRFSNRLHCAACDIEYRPASHASFSFNHPLGACPQCKGFGRVISIDYRQAIPDRSRSIAGGLVKPWQTGQGAECQADLLRMCRELEIPTDVPFEDLPERYQQLVLEGDPEYGKDEEHEWPRAWYGVKGYFRWLESKAYKMHVRVLLSRYRAYTPCPACEGRRFQPDTLLYRTPRGLTLADFYQMPVQQAAAFMRTATEGLSAKPNDPHAVACSEVLSRLHFLESVGLGYLTLDRPTRTLSGGETERVNLTTCLGSKLVNTLFVLDEPSVGLHAKDTERLVLILKQLRDAGNTVVVVEHEAAVMRAADQIVDLGPGHGTTGGHVVFQGTYRELLRSKKSLTGDYLSGARETEPSRRRTTHAPGHEARRKGWRSGEALVLNETRAAGLRDIGNQWLRLEGASKHNVRNISAAFPLHRFVCVSGVSGSGKTTLVREILAPALAAHSGAAALVKASDRLSGEDSSGDEDESETPSGPSRVTGAEHIRRVVLVDQCTLSKTPRSNPAVYVGAFDAIREVFAQSPVAERRGLNASAFSFNSAQGQCERCRGAGFEKIEMQFLSDIFIRCPACLGRRYRTEILEVRIRPFGVAAGRALSIADVLDSTAEEAIQFLEGFGKSRRATSAIRQLRWLADVGLGYLKLGQPLNTLSGGENQRLKLAKHLADYSTEATGLSGQGRGAAGSTDLFIFDEPTTGLHFHDVSILLGVFQRLVDNGHSVLVIEHNLDVLKSADWLIDLGPGGGTEGGQIVAEGTPEDVAGSNESATGMALRHLLSSTANLTRREARCA